MKKLFVRALIGLIIASLSGFSLFLYFLNWSPRARKSWANVKNAKQVRLGMSTKEVLRLMGDPDEIIKPIDKKYSMKYYYEPPFLASDGIYIALDSQGVVKRIVNYE